MRVNAPAVWMIGIALALSSGCVATAQSTPARGVVVSGPPPAPLAEDHPAIAPAGGAQWVAGYWHWTGMQYAWIPGHWETPPPGSSWSAPRYMAADGAYFYEPGAWNGGQPLRSPQPAQAPSQTPHANALR